MTAAPANPASSQERLVDAVHDFRHRISLVSKINTMRRRSRARAVEEAQLDERLSYSQWRSVSTDTSWMLEADLMAGLHVEQEESSLTIESDALAHAERSSASAAAAAAAARAAAAAVVAEEARAAADIEAQKVRLQSSMGRSLARLDRLFEAADSDGDGSFDRREFRGLVATLGLPASDAACDALFDSYDSDGSGSISFTEFLQGQLRAYLAKAARRLIDVFRACDVDRSRTVDRDEFVDGVSSLGLKVKRRHIADLFDAMDTDGSGKLDFKELHAALKGDSAVELQAKNRVSIRELRDRKAQRRASWIDGVVSPAEAQPRAPQAPHPQILYLSLIHI